MIKDSYLSALSYIYCQNCKAIKEGTLKGLRYKQAFQFKKMIEDLALAYEQGKITDFEEVLKYGE